MPRIPTRVLREAYTIDPLLPRLLPPCRDLGAAQNELRWLREHVDLAAKARRASGDVVSKSAFLRDLVQQRASGKPLQYLLGTEFFGDIEIRCRPGVLIPRQDTAASVQRLVRLVRDAQNLPHELRLLDLCTGTGCIPLLFHHDFYAARPHAELRALGIDISSKALQLAIYNLRRVRKTKGWVDKGSIGFTQADVLANPFADVVRNRLAVSSALRYARLPHIWDILISNPPYISPSGYWKTTTRSVRGFEPKLALVPPSTTAHGDAFYLPIINIASEVEAKIVLLEVADLDQALRVARAAQASRLFDGIEIWREQPDEPHDPSLAAVEFPVLGLGHARSVICWRGIGATWLGKTERTLANEDITSPPTSLHPQFQADAATRPQQGLQLLPHWVRQLNELQTATKHNLWRETTTKSDSKKLTTPSSAGEDTQTPSRTTVGPRNPSSRASDLSFSQYLNTHPHKKASVKPRAYATEPTDVEKVSRRRHLSEEQQQRLVQCYQAGWKVQALADEFRISFQTMYRYLHLKGVPVGVRRSAQGEVETRAPRLRYSKEQQKRLLQYYQAGWQVQAIADALGCSDVTVYNYLHRWSILKKRKKA